MEDRDRGFLLVLCTAVISGFSIFINRFALAQFDPFVFAVLKNSMTAVCILSFIYLSKKAGEIVKIRKMDLAKLAVWGAFDGGVAFLLYFYGMKLSNAADASLIHKSMFLFASALAVVFLKERIDRKQLLAGVIILSGAALLSGALSSSVGIGEIAMLGAVLLWSAGNVVCKKLLSRISPTNIAFGRMFFGSLLMLVFLAASGDAPAFSSLTTNHYIWLLLTTALLVGYQLTYFNGLKLLKVSEATSLLVLGSVVTSLLSVFVTSLPAPAELLGMAAVTAGLGLVYLFPGGVKNVRDKTVQSC